MGGSFDAADKHGWTLVHQFGERQSRRAG